MPIKPTRESPKKSRKRRVSARHRKSYNTSFRLTLDQRVFLAIHGGPAEYIRKCINRDMKAELALLRRTELKQKK